MTEDIINPKELLDDGSLSSLGDFYRAYLPTTVYEQILVGNKAVYDESVAESLNSVFLSWYFPANRAINSGEYAPTHDLEYEMRMWAYDLVGMGLIPEWFFNKIISIR